MAAAVTVPKLTRITRIALWVNAVLHFLGSLGMILGLDPNAAAEPMMARRAGVPAVAAFVMFVLVSRRIERDPALIALPWSFVLCNFGDTIYEFATSRDPHFLAPAIPEATFLVLYSIFAVSFLRRRATRV